MAARALLHLGECYEKLGQSEAQKAYERLLREYPDQKEAAEARARLATRDSGAPGEVTLQRLWAGDEVDNVSPDGRYLAFTDWRTGKGGVGLRDLKTGESRTLSDSATRAADLLFSPDGTQIAYRCETNSESTQYRESIRLIGSDGKRDREIAHIEEYGILLSAWSPDGKKIAGIHFYSRGDQTNQIILLSTTDGSITRLKSTGWRRPTIGGFSPDGHFLVYSLNNSPAKTDGGIFAIAINGSHEAPVVPGIGGPAGIFSRPVWAPDGHRIVFLSDRSGTKDLWSIRVANGRPEGPPELLKAEVGTIGLKGFARDGSLYYGTTQLMTHVYTAELDAQKLVAGTPARITEQFIGSNFEPELSPDGKLVAFLRRPAGELGPRPATLVIRSLDNGEERLLTVAGICRQRPVRHREVQSRRPGVPLHSAFVGLDSQGSSP